MLCRHAAITMGCFTNLVGMNDTPLNLKWKLKLTVELAPGESVERDVTEWKRGKLVDLASLGLSMEEGKTILAGIQTRW